MPCARPVPDSVLPSGKTVWRATADFIKAHG